MKAKKLYFEEFGDARGHLVVAEGETPEQIPFVIKRVFYIYGSDSDVVRGCHANQKSEFVLINVSGTSKVKVMDGSCEKIFELNNPREGVYIPAKIWKEMYDFSENSVLLVLSSEHYDKQEYIRNYADYLEYIKK